MSDPNREVKAVNRVRLADLEILQTGGCGLIPELEVRELGGPNEGAR